jgi:hypothetical protein
LYSLDGGERTLVADELAADGVLAADTCSDMFNPRLARLERSPTLVVPAAFAALQRRPSADPVAAAEAARGAEGGDARGAAARGEVDELLRHHELQRRRRPRRPEGAWLSATQGGRVGYLDGNHH